MTCREYLAFLNELHEADPDEAALRVPRKSEKVGACWPQEPDGKYVIPTTAWISEDPEERMGRVRKLGSTTFDWEEEWPVLGISWEDGMTYSAWYGKKHGIQASLPHEIMWEKAARGVDGRFYPFGNHHDNTFANTLWSREGPQKPCSVHSFPLDESPYGVRGLCGNAKDMCINDIDDGQRRLLRGGAWFALETELRASDRSAQTPVFIHQCNGFRLFALPFAMKRPE